MGVYNTSVLICVLSDIASIDIRADGSSSIAQSVNQEAWKEVLWRMPELSL